MPYESFILQTYLEDLNLCDDIIETYTNSPYKYEGVIVRSGNLIVDKTTKDSTEIPLNIYTELFSRYAAQLQKCVDIYIQKYETCNLYSRFNFTENINIQHYKPGGCYGEWHTERGEINNNRHLVFMTYLNDVTDQGGTEFYNQKIITEPKKGLTLIWPADWTHTHRGIASSTQDKYIATGWLSYV